MFDKISKEKDKSVVGESVFVDGIFEAKEDVVIFGTVNGSIKTDSDVYIKESAKINANIKCKNIFVEGDVVGNIDSEELIEIYETAKIKGDLSAKYVNISKGAIFNGSCKIKEVKEIKETKDPKDVKEGKLDKNKN